MSLLPAVEIKLKPGLATDAFNKACDDLRNIPGILDLRSISSQEDTLVSTYTGGSKTIDAVRTVANVISAQDAPHRL